MIRIQAINQTTSTETELDTFGDETIPITLTVDDMRNIGSKNASFTKDFDLPATKNNNKFFEQVYDLQVDSSYNPRAKTEVNISDDGVEVFSGSMYLNEVLEKDGTIVYRVNVFSEVVNFLDALGEATLADLDYTDLAHTFNAANVEASWGAGVTLTAGGTSDDVFYPLIDVGNLSYYFSSGLINLNYHSSLNYIPFVKMYYIVQKMFTYAGFTCDSDFFDTDYFKAIYTDTNTNSQGNDYEYDTISASMVGVSSQEIDGATTVAFNTEEDDGNGLYNISTRTYTSPAANVTVYIEGTIAFEGIQGDVIQVVAECSIGGSTNTIVLTTAAIYNAASGTAFLSATEVLGGYASFYETIELENASDTIIIKVNTITDEDASDDFPRIKSTIDQYNFFPNPDVLIGSYSTNVFFGTISNGIDIDHKMKLYRNDVKLSDVFKDLTKMFNLVVEPINNRRIKVEPYDDFNSNGVTRYWEEKIDRSEIKQEFYPIPSKITWRYNNDEDDFMLNLYPQWFGVGEEAGTMSIYPNTTQIDEQEISLDVFSFTMPNYIFSVYTEVDLQKIPFENKPRLGIKHGAFAATTTDQLNIVNVEAYGSLKVNGQYGTISQDLGFDPYFGSSGLYDTFWHNYIQDRYTDESLILHLRIKLTAGDIANFSFADIIIIDNQTYRVNKIRYEAGSTELARVELFKISNNKGGAN